MPLAYLAPYWEGGGLVGEHSPSLSVPIPRGRGEGPTGGGLFDWRARCDPVCVMHLGPGGGWGVIPLPLRDARQERPEGPRLWVLLRTILKCGARTNFVMEPPPNAGAAPTAVDGRP